MLTETEVKIVLILADDKGHAEWELADILGMETSNLNPILKSLRSKRVIIKGPARQSKRERKLHKAGEYQETPYYLSNNIDDIKTLVRELIQSDRVLDVGFSLGVIKRSAYLKSMSERFGPDLAKKIADEVLQTYQPYTDPKFKMIIQQMKMQELLFPFLQGDLVESLTEKAEVLRSEAAPSELEIWYKRYLRAYPDQDLLDRYKLILSQTWRT